MKTFFERFKNRFKKKQDSRAGKLPLKVVYNRFRRILANNARALDIMADMGDKLGGRYIFDVKYIKKTYSEFADTVFQSIYNLNALANNRYLSLHGRFEKINNQIVRIINGKSPFIIRHPVIFYKDITWEMSEEVGGKNANLAELRNYLKINVPDGFAITTSAFREFVEYNDIESKIEGLKNKYRKAAQRSQKEDILSAITFAEAGEHETAKSILTEEDYLNEDFFLDVQKLFKKGKIPPSITDPLERGLDTMKKEYGGDFFLAVRSSAEKEDMDFSFAGQFETILNVPPELKDVKNAYKEVLASLFSTSAVSFREQIIPKNGPMMGMSVGCIRMVDAETSGVMYSMDPARLDSNVVIINANWGLGQTVVEGSVDADHYEVEKGGGYRLVKKRIGDKDFMADTVEDGGVDKVLLTGGKKNKACLTGDQLNKLARQAVLIEHYMKIPQDIEWAIDKNGEIFILQARPLRFSAPGPVVNEGISSALREHGIAMEGVGMVAQRGIGSGRVFVLEGLESLTEFAPGSVLVAKHDSSQFIKVMQTASAIITDVGTPTSHMANIAREFQVPAIVNTGIATSVLKNGDDITVDADDNRVYYGVVKELLREKITREISSRESDELRLLRKILRYITPLNLLDPLEDNFKPGSCLTLHDIIHFIHEKAIGELVQEAWRDEVILKGGITARLDAPLSFEVFVVDIGGGINKQDVDGGVTLAETVCAPFAALVSGMIHLPCPDKPGSGKSTAVISSDYMNVCLRFGRRFYMIDSYCSENVRDNHIYFRFEGEWSGSKDEERGTLLENILREWDMQVSKRERVLIARTGNISRAEADVVLNVIGRMIIFTDGLELSASDGGAIEEHFSNFRKMFD